MSGGQRTKTLGKRKKTVEDRGGEGLGFINSGSTACLGSTQRDNRTVSGDLAGMCSRRMTILAFFWEPLG